MRMGDIMNLLKKIFFLKYLQNSLNWNLPNVQCIVLKKITCGQKSYRKYEVTHGSYCNKVGKIS